MRIILLLALFMAFVSFSNAQMNGAKRSPEDRAQRIMEDESFRAFNLTAEQKVKILSILVSQNKSLDSLIATIPPGNNSQQAIIQVMAPKRVAIIAANDTRIATLLNEEQKKTYQEYVKKRPPGSVFNGQAGPGVPVR